MTVQKSADGKELRIAGSSCHDRFCTPCGVERSERIQRVLNAHCENRSLKFVTLTLRHQPGPLRERLTRLLRCWRRLRATKFWRSRVSGGIYVLEIKLSATSRCWHAHLHLILESKFLPQRELSEVWHRVTGDSYIVDVRAVTDKQRGVAYVTKYVGKPLDGTVYNDPERLREYVLAARSVRFCGAFGSWRGLQLETRTEPAGEWSDIGLLTTILQRAADGDAASLDLLVALRRKYFWIPRGPEKKERPP